jgi:hypothetical protein
MTEHNEPTLNAYDAAERISRLEGALMKCSNACEALFAACQTRVENCELCDGCGVIQDEPAEGGEVDCEECADLRAALKQVQP